jgi:hypothetical protein
MIKNKTEVERTGQEISFHKWQKRGYSKGILHYLKQNAMSGKPFMINRHVYCWVMYRIGGSCALILWFQRPCTLARDNITSGGN